jgi:predicted acylesterase/phospholipase RssA
MKKQLMALFIFVDGCGYMNNVQAYPYINKDDMSIVTGCSAGSMLGSLGAGVLTIKAIGKERFKKDRRFDYVVATMYVLGGLVGTGCGLVAAAKIRGSL